MKVIGVRFKSTKKIYYFNPNELEIKKGDNVVVETSRGIEFGQTVIGIKDIPEDEIVHPLQNVVRIATPEDERTVQYNEERRQDAIDKCQQKIEKHGLDMKLVDAEYTFDQTKLIFYFTSGGRVDFRDLVKDLAFLFRTRIELRQIAVRDETKMLGGLGACGNEICCKRFLGDFASVSIKMAKDQNLSLNPTKISGLCGRLICCLNFEKNFYSEMNEKLPAVGELVISPKGQAEVVQTYPLKESIRVKYTNTDGSTDTAIFKLAEITRTHEISPDSRVQPAEDKNDAELEKLADADIIQDEAGEVSENEQRKPRDNNRNNKFNSNKGKNFKDHRQKNSSENEPENASEGTDEKKEVNHSHFHQNSKKDFKKNNQPQHQNQKNDSAGHPHEEAQASAENQPSEKKKHFSDHKKSDNHKADNQKSDSKKLNPDQNHNNPQSENNAQNHPHHDNKNGGKKFNNFKSKKKDNEHNSSEGSSSPAHE